MAHWHRKTNEIDVNCVECNTSRLMAYWDDEIESYIYLFEEDELLCQGCRPKQPAIATLSHYGISK
jgi:hypothetical protein